MSNHASTVLYKIFICVGEDNESLSKHAFTGSYKIFICVCADYASMSKHASTGSYKIFICVGADQERVHEFRLDQLLVVDHTQVLELVQGVDLS